MKRVHGLMTGVVVGVLALSSAERTLGQFQSHNVNLLSWLDLPDFPSNPSSGNDCWGYVSSSGREYALMGIRDAMAVVEITDPINPVIVTTVPHNNSLWGDIKVYQDYCYVCNESGGGIQVIDLSDIDNGIATLVRTFGPNTNHNLAIDEDSGFLYTCGGRYVYDLSDPSNPTSAGQIVGQYLHDLQAVTYTSGPYAGRQIVFGGSESRGIDIFDVTDKNNMVRLSRTTYTGVSYCHQMWLTEDRRYLLVDDELDEINGYTNVTLTRVFDVSDLSAPVLAATFTSGLPAIDHNLYVKGNFCFEADYRSGLRIFDISDPLSAVEKGWFDTYPGNDSPNFDGAWSVYPYFPSGTVIISDITRGLFIVDAGDILGRRVLPGSFNVTRSAGYTGVVDDLFESDDNRLVMIGIPAISPIAPAIIVEVYGNSSIHTASQLTLTVESAASIPFIEQVMQGYNFDTAQWEDVDVSSMTNDDVSRQIVIDTNASRFIDGSTGDVALRLLYRPAGPLIAAHWTAQVDQAVWDVVP